MVKETTYEVDLDSAMQLRVRFTRERNRIISFVVQLECLIGEKWYPVVRYDTAHQFAHCDILRPDGSQEKLLMPVSKFNESLTYAQEDMMINSHRYCERFKEWFNG